MEVIIFGAGKNGYRLKKTLEEAGNIIIKYFCDNNEKKRGMTLDGIPIISFDEMVRYVKEEKIKCKIYISVLDVDTIVRQIRAEQIDVHVYGLSGLFYKKEQIRFKHISEISYEIDYKKPRLNYIEYQVADHCNLKCKGCGHFSNLVAPKFGNLQQFTSDLKQLKTKFWGIKRIRLMGGEPLLNRELPEFIKETRCIFPDAEIRIVTNGLLIPKVESRLFNMMRDCLAGFDISLYLPTKNVMEEIELCCIQEDVEFRFSPLVEKFFRTSQKREKCTMENFMKCRSKSCHFLRDGKLALCLCPILVSEYGDLANQHGEFDENDIIDLYTTKLTGDEILEYLSKPIQACDWCGNADEVEWFGWEGNYPYPL